MNRKGDYAKTIIYFALAIAFFVLMVIGIIKIAGDDKAQKVCKPESCYVRADGCPTGKFHISVYKCEDAENNMCCLSPEEQAKYKSGTQANASEPGTTTSNTAQTGNVYIKLGESATTISSKTLYGGTQYTFKITADGNISSCEIKILDRETMSITTDQSWVTISGAGTECRTGFISIAFNPKVAQINKDYRVQVEGKNSTGTIKTATLDLKVVMDPSLKI